MDYLQETQYIAQVDTHDNILGKVEKWEAHKSGILHRAFTITLYYEDRLILQHRKHPVFDQVFDITISSHQLFENDKLQNEQDTLLATLKREWNLTSDNLDSLPEHKGSILYRAKDPRSDYIEHEICHIYSCKIKKLMLPNFDFAYGFSLKSKEEITNPFDPLYPLLAPWVHKAMENKLL